MIWGNPFGPGDEVDCVDGHEAAADQQAAATAGHEVLQAVEEVGEVEEVAGERERELLGGQAGRSDRRSRRKLRPAPRGADGATGRAAGARAATSLSWSSGSTACSSWSCPRPRRSAADRGSSPWLPAPRSGPDRSATGRRRPAGRPRPAWRAACTGRRRRPSRASPAATWLRAVSSWLCSPDDLGAEAGGLVALGRDHQHPPGHDRAHHEHDDDHHAVAGRHWVPPGWWSWSKPARVEVTPETPAFGTGWKNTTRSKVGPPAPQPWDEPPDSSRWRPTPASC